MIHYYIMLVALLFLFTNAEGLVYIPENDYKGYFNSAGFYTIVGKVVSTEPKPIKPTIHVEVIDDGKVIKKDLEWVPILNVPSLAREIPFKMIIPEVKGKDPIINKIYVTYEYLNRESINVVALYDNSLIMYNDHVTGRVINLGNKTVYNIRVYAGAHAINGSWLDTSISQEIIEELRPGESKPFTLYIDPIFKGQVGYYSCFAPSDPYVMNLTTTRNDEKFEVYAISDVWFYNPKFDEETNTLHLEAASNSLPLPIKVKFRVPVSSLDEKFQVYLDGDVKDVYQSIDEDGMTWHLTFDYPPTSFVKDIRILGFKDMHYKYVTLKPNNSTKVILQIPREIHANEPSTLRLAFYNTNDTLMKNISYNIKILENGKLELDLNRVTLTGVDVINYTFNNNGNFDVNLDINGMISKTSIVVIPEFPFSLLIISLSMLMIVIYKKIRIVN